MRQPENMIRSNAHTQEKKEKPGIRQDRQKITFHEPAYTKEIPSQCTTATQTDRDVNKTLKPEIETRLLALCPR